MRKPCGIVIIPVLLLAAGAQASVGWAQNFTVGAINQVEWLGGIGSAAAVNKASYDQRQQFGSTYTNLRAHQRKLVPAFRWCAPRLV